MSRAYVGRDASVCCEVGGTVALLPLRTVEDDLNMVAPLMRSDKSFGDGCEREGIGLKDDKECCRRSESKRHVRKDGEL